MREFIILVPSSISESKLKEKGPIVQPGLGHQIFILITGVRIPLGSSKRLQLSRQSISLLMRGSMVRVHQVSNQKHLQNRCFFFVQRLRSSSFCCKTVACAVKNYLIHYIPLIPFQEEERLGLSRTSINTILINYPRHRAIPKREKDTLPLLIFAMAKVLRRLLLRSE